MIFWFFIPAVAGAIKSTNPGAHTPPPNNPVQCRQGWYTENGIARSGTIRWEWTGPFQ